MKNNNTQKNNSDNHKIMFVSSQKSSDYFFKLEFESIEINHLASKASYQLSILLKKKTYRTLN